MYAFLLHWAVSSIETREASEKANPRRSNDSSSAAAKRGKGAKAKKNEEWDPSDKLERSLDVMKKVLSLRLIRIFDATSERDTFVTLFTKAVFHLLEDEAKVKKRGMKDRCYRVLCVAVKFHNQTFSRLSRHYASENMG
jgi:condensin complex subunit 1